MNILKPRPPGRSKAVFVREMGGVGLGRLMHHCTYIVDIKLKKNTAKINFTLSIIH
jgi:hypothetical protein